LLAADPRSGCMDHGIENGGSENKEQ